MERKVHTIDAAGKVLGRLAAEIAVLLRGKHKPDFVPYKDTGDFVVVKNIEKLKFTGKKLEKEKQYYYSGYSGGLKKMPLKKIFQKKPEILFKKTVLGMMSRNKLRINQIKRLKIEK